MKTLFKKLILSCTALAAACALAAGFAACGETPEDTPSSFNISVEQSADYTIEVEDSAAPLDEVELTVTVNNPDKYLTGVTYNGKQCYGSDGEYSFTMPAADVVLKADLADYEEKLSDGVVTFSSANQQTISVGGTNYSYWDEDNNLVECWRFDIAMNWGSYNTMLSRGSYVLSSNQAVIPADAITFRLADKASDGSWYYGVDVLIDTSKIKAGSTWLNMYFQSGQSSSKDGAICVRITVTEDAVEPEKMDVVFTYTNESEQEDGGIFFNVTDTSTNDIQTIYAADFAGGKYTFEYVVGRTYRVTCAYAEYNEDTGKYENMIDLDLNEWYGTNSGGAQNTLVRNGNTYTLTLTTEGIEVPFIVIDDID